MSNPPPSDKSDFPSNVLKWMKENAAPKMALKLMKCCKYFQHFPQFPFFVVKEVSKTGYIKNNWFFETINNKRVFCEGTKGLENIGKKLWITKTISLSEFPNLVTCIIPKIAVCDILNLSLCNQILSFDEFKFLTSSGNVQNLIFRNTVIKYENGESVFIDSIFKCVPNILEFFHDNHEISILSLNSIKTFSQIDISKMRDISINIESYSYFEIFTEIIKKNPHVLFKLDFNPTSLSQTETKTVEKYVQEIIDAGITKYPPPFITFPGQTDKQSNSLIDLATMYVNKRDRLRYLSFLSK